MAQYTQHNQETVYVALTKWPFDGEDCL